MLRKCVQTLNRQIKLADGKIAPQARITLRHFNAVGLAGWILNGRLLKKESIGVGSIRAFERICPWVSKIDDVLHQKLSLPIGQSLLCVLEWD